MLLHASINTAAIFGNAPGWVLTATFVSVAVLIVIVTRGRLSYGDVETRSDRGPARA